MLMRQSDFAKKVGTSRQYINKLVKQGVIPSYERGQVKYDEAKRALENHQVPYRQRQREKNKAERLKKMVPSMFDVDLGYESVADMSEEEKRARSIETLRKLRDEAVASGVDVVRSVEDIEKLDAKELNRLILEQDLRLKKAKADEAEGKVLPVETVKNAIFEATRILRDGLLGIPARTASALASMDDPHACRTLLEEEIVRQLESLSEAIRGMQ